MASNRESLGFNWDQRLWLSGGRNRMPPGTLRRAVGIAPELTGSVRSRWGSTFQYPINANTVWNGTVLSGGITDNIIYAFDGNNLYANGSVLVADFPIGGNLTFVRMPPQPGLQDYTFVLGGGKMFKIDPSGNVTNWGIQAPPNGASVIPGVPDTIVIDNMVADNTSNWTHSNTSLAFDSSDEPYLTGGCYKLSISAGPWYIEQTFGSTQNWAVYGGGTPISLQTDLVSIYANFLSGTNNLEDVVWIEFMVDVEDGTFKNNYYTLTFQLVPTTSNQNAAGAAVITLPSPGQWVQLAGTKAQFTRVGTELNLDWSNVQAVRIRGGNPQSAGSPVILLNAFQIYGGFPLGVGPAALAGGSEYQYAVTFGATLTGSDSNPNGMVVNADGTVSPPTPFVAQGVALEPDFLTNIPVSSDPQVGYRKLWRTSADGDLFFYLDTIPDNSTTTYEDVIGDLAGQPLIVTPWTNAVAVTTGYMVDGGNGFYFIVSTGGTTGANIPQWNVPTGPFLGNWVPWLTYSVGDWVSYLGVGFYAAASSRNVKPVAGGPVWNATLGGTTADGTVTWTNRGHAVWQATHAYTTGALILDANGNIQYCLSGGTSGGTVPVWNTTIYNSITLTGITVDGSVTWGNFLRPNWQPSFAYSSSPNPINNVIRDPLGDIQQVTTSGTSEAVSSSGPWVELGTTNDNGVIWTWGGLNAVPTLGLSTELLYDNQAPQLSYGDVAGPFEGSLFWTRDTTPGREGWVYASPPGRPESVGTFFAVSSDQDPMQKVVIWDQLVWAMSQQNVWLVEGSYPALTTSQLKNALGTEFPYTVVSGQNGVYYRAADGIRMFDRGGSVLAGFPAIAPILRGNTVENVASFQPVWAALVRDEIFFGDGTVTFGLGGQSPVSLIDAPQYVWRMLGQGLQCAYYERSVDEIIASFGGNVVLWEVYGVLSD